MSNKPTVETYMQAYMAGDHAKILTLLTDDVVWDLPGAFCKVGKATFAEEIKPTHYENPPVIQVTRMVEEGNVVIAEGTVLTHYKGQNPLKMVFCDVFEFETHLIKRLTTYLMNTGNNT